LYCFNVRYDTQYRVQQWSSTDFDRFSSPKPVDSLFLPRANQFIATDFNLKHVSSSKQPSNERSPPMNIQVSPISVWFKADSYFLKPKVNVLCKFISPFAYLTPKHAVLTSLYTRILEDELNEFAYDADLAGLSYSLWNTSVGIQLVFGGYNHKLGILVKAVIDKMNNLAVKEDRFLLIKEQTTRQLKNFKYEAAYQHALYDENFSLEQNLWHNAEKLAVIGAIQAEDIKAFQSVLLSQLHCEMLVHGNLASEEAIEISKIIHSTLRFEPLFASQLPDLRTIALAPATRYLWATRELNEAEENSAIVLTLQFGQDTPHNNALIELFAQTCKDLVFNQLRTIEQLGYLVWSGISNHRGVLHFRIIIQSSNKNPIYLEQRAEAFLHNFRSELQNLTEQQFNEYLTAVIARKQEKDKTLTQETNRHWKEIDLRRFQFNRQELEVKELQLLTKEKLVEFYEKIIEMNSRERRKLSVRIFGKRHELTQNDEIIELKTTEQSSSDSNIPIEIAATSSNENPNSPPVVLSWSPADNSALVLIKDFHSFKSCMPLYPCFV
jgi:insulysin